MQLQQQLGAGLQQLQALSQQTTHLALGRRQVHSFVATPTILRQSATTIYTTHVQLTCRASRLASARLKLCQTSSMVYFPNSHTQVS